MQKVWRLSYESASWRLSRNPPGDKKANLSLVQGQFSKHPFARPQKTTLIEGKGHEAKPGTAWWKPPGQQEVLLHTGAYHPVWWE